MAITIPTYDDIAEQVLAFFRNRFPGKDTHTESFLGKTARAVARSIASFHVSVQNADNDSLPNTKSSSQALSNAAYAYGLPSGVAGVYGPKGASTASGGEGYCTGTNGTVFPDGTLLTAPDATTQIKLSGAVTIPGAAPGTGQVLGKFVAVTAGTVGNLAADTVLTWQNPPSGADSTVTLTAALSGALDSETSPALLTRILDRLQNPPKGGTANDYRTWAESQSGVFRAYVYPKRSGTGTVDLVITSSGSGTARKPTASVQSLVNSYINGDSTNEGTRPVTVEGYTTVLPYTAPSGLAIRVRVVNSLGKYAFDWALGTTTFTVASYAAGVITMTQALPASLTAAIDLYKAGTASAPRLQVISTGAPVVSIPVQATDYSAGSKTITLQSTLPTGWIAPTAGDAVYPYGPAVDTISNNILGYVDGLGPSRVGGYANALDSWEDTCAIYRLAQIALDATDTDGTKFCKNVSAVTINGAATDVEATDTIANGIELLYTKTIAVTD